MLAIKLKYSNMVRIPPSKVQAKLDEDEDINYGTGYTEGDPKNFEDTEKMVKDAVGNEPDDDEDGFSLVDEVEKDEEARLEDKPEDSEEAELEEELEKIENKEKFKEDSSDE